VGLSKVYFTDLKTRSGYNLLDKLENLLKKSGMLNINFEKKFTAIKIHFGEPGNLAFIRPNFVSVVSNIIKRKGGIPFLTDCNTLYKGKRANAVDHLKSALENGFNYITTGCNIIIGDGLKGTDYREIEINQKNCKFAKIGSAIADADIIITMNHFKGHEMAGFGGCIKNLAMGCASVGGKLEMHSSSKPIIKQDKCVGCKLCLINCPKSAISMNESNKATINYDICIGCGQCIAVCRYDAARVKWDSVSNIFYEKLAEYALAAIKNKPSFHINFLLNISPGCDCFPFNDMPIVNDIGILASFDPVAIDVASADLVNKTNYIPGSKVNNSLEDKFKQIYNNTDWRICTEYAEKIGLGNQNYEIIKID